MRFIYLLLLGALFTTVIHAEDEREYKNQSWYNSKELKKVIILANKYDQNCLSFDDVESNISCKKVEAEISGQFNNLLLDDSAVHYISEQVHPNYKKYSQIEHSSFVYLKMKLSEFAVQGKSFYIENLLNSQKVSKNKDIDVSDFKSVFLKSGLNHRSYTSSVCAMGNSYFNSGSGSGIATSFCLTVYNLKYVAALNEVASALEGKIEIYAMDVDD